MYFICLIEYQKNKLASRATSIALEKNKYRNFISADTAMCQVNSAHMTFTKNTRTFMGALKSFIPGTKAFKSRVICAKCISNAHSRLNEAVRALKPAKDTPVVTGNNKKKTSPSTTLPKVHRSPINAAPVKKQTKNTNDGYVCNAAAPRLS